MTRAEQEFKLIVHGLVGVGVYPSPSQIRSRQSRLWSGMPRSQENNLCGRETKWRESVLRQLGWTWVGRGNSSIGQGTSWEPSAEWKEQS